MITQNSQITHLIKIEYVDNEVFNFLEYEVGEETLKFALESDFETEELIELLEVADDTRLLRKY